LLASILDQALYYTTQALIAAAVALVGYIAVKVKAFVDKKSKDIDVEKVSFVDERINEYLWSLRDRLDAARVYISKFHNGDHYVDGSEVLKKTRTHETVKHGLRYQREEYKAMPISRVPDEMKLVREPGASFVLVKDLPRGNFKWLCMEGGAEAVARCALRKNGLMIGFLGVDFDREEPPTEEQLMLICEIASRVEQLM
jgi:hypothetical protein